jgi:hypothetical protein
MTVRDWLSRYHERAPALSRGLTAWTVGQGEEVGRLDLDGDRRAAAALALPGAPGAGEPDGDRSGRGGCGV